jgi:hypothetical protein
MRQYQRNEAAPQNTPRVGPFSSGRT